jgi:hypothetical protein
MALAVEAPAREDLSFRTNDDKLVGARWMASATTPIFITTAAMALRFDPIEPPDYPIVNPLIVVPPDIHQIESTTPNDPAGWIDADNLANGVVLVTVPHGIWAGHATRTGIWDLIAVAADGTQRCLVRGVFVVEEGVST